MRAAAARQRGVVGGGQREDALDEAGERLGVADGEQEAVHGLLDVLGNAVAKMVASLSALVGEVHKSGIQVNTSVTEIAATSRQQQATASEIEVKPRQ